jgi:hypothetical protein
MDHSRERLMPMTNYYRHPILVTVAIKKWKRFPMLQLYGAFLTEAIRGGMSEPLAIRTDIVVHDDLELTPDDVSSIR